MVVAAGLAIQVAALRNRSELASELEHETARTLAGVAEPEEATQLIIERLARVLGWQTGAFWEADPRREVLRCVALWHEPGLDADQLPGATTRALELEGGAGLPGTVWRTGQATWVRDVSRDAGFLRADSAMAAGLRGRCRVPDRHIGPGPGRRRVLHGPCPAHRRFPAAGDVERRARSSVST